MYQLELKLFWFLCAKELARATLTGKFAAPAGRLDTAAGRVPDVLVHLELKTDFEIVLENPIDELAWFELIKHSREQNRKASGKVKFLNGFFGPEVVFAGANDKLDFIVRLKFVQIPIEIVP